MKRIRCKSTLSFLLAVFCLQGAQSCRPGESVPRNVILFIADGCGFNHMEAASLFAHGLPEAQVYARFPIKYAMTTYPAEGSVYDPHSAWKTFSYVEEGATDSAAAATAMATGIKTYNGAINVDLQRERLTTTFEVAEQRGRSTGIVTSVYFTHATPACFAAHNPRRNNTLSIGREMLLESPVDVIMGCGHPDYNKQGKPSLKPRYQNVGGRETWEALQQGRAGGDADQDGEDDPWSLIETREEFIALASGPTPRRVLGVPRIYATLQQDRMGDGQAAPYAVPELDGIPSLEEMTLAALNVLDEDRDGFFLMVEGGAVDWAAHDHQAGRMIEELIDFDKAVEAAVEWVESNSSWKETLIIVTSDHETGYLTGPGSGEAQLGDDGGSAEWIPLHGRGRGEAPAVQWNKGGHTNSLVPFFAKGAGSQRFEQYAVGSDPVRGTYLDNTDIGRVLFSFLEDH
ncbi:alkaline phosphatase [Acidobacteriota bacterium]